MERQINMETAKWTYKSQSETLAERVVYLRFGVAEIY